MNQRRVLFEKRSDKTFSFSLSYSLHYRNWKLFWMNISGVCCGHVRLSNHSACKHNSHPSQYLHILTHPVLAFQSSSQMTSSNEVLLPLCSYLVWDVTKPSVSFNISLHQIKNPIVEVHSENTPRVAEIVWQTYAMSNWWSWTHHFFFDEIGGTSSTFSLLTFSFSLLAN